MNRIEALRFIGGYGWTAEQAAGVVASLVRESNLNPAAVGDNGLAYGAAQWHPDRQHAFELEMGKPIRGSSIEEQLEFVHRELMGREKAAGDALRACKTAAEAGAVVSKRYERPGDVEGEAARRGALAETILAEYLASLPVEPAPAPAPAPQPAPTTTPSESPMPILALISAFGPLLAQLIPQIAPLVSGERAKQNLTLAGKVFDVITTTAAQPNLQAAIEKMQADPQTVQAVKNAIVTHPEIQPHLQIVEVGGGAAAARAADLKAQIAEVPFYKSSPVFWVSVLLLPIVYWLVGSLIAGGIVTALTKQDVELPAWAMVLLSLFGSAWDGESRAGGFNLVIGLILGGICGVYYGVSVTQAKAAQQQQQANDTAEGKPTGVTL